MFENGRAATVLDGAIISMQSQNVLRAQSRESKDRAL